MVIDVWAQHPTNRFINHPCFDSLKRWTGQSTAELAIPLDCTVGAMQQSGVQKALIAAWHGPNGDLISNEEVKDCIEQHPDLFVGLASTDLRKPVEGVRELRKYVKEHGFKGLRIVQWLWDMPCTDPLYYPLLAECVELDVPVCLQVGLTGPLCTSRTGQPQHIERIALDFPELKIVCGHIGAPWHQEMIAYARKFPNVYIDTSAYMPKRYPAELVDYMKTHGKHKVMFGSNFPMLLPGECLKQLDLLKLDDETQQCFLYKNAEQVFAL
ncbi:amidohydrolase [Gammaproteobacteria bacterium 45_16_T64]|nr:amidohydrolase [Gammaproteobacteria bacterium 45_16_T64]